MRLKPWEGEAINKKHSTETWAGAETAFAAQVEKEGERERDCRENRSTTQEDLKGRVLSTPKSTGLLQVSEFSRQFRRKRKRSNPSRKERLESLQHQWQPSFGISLVHPGWSLPRNWIRHEKTMASRSADFRLATVCFNATTQSPRRIRLPPAAYMRN